MGEREGGGAGTRLPHQGTKSPNQRGWAVYTPEGSMSPVVKSGRPP